MRGWVAVGRRDGRAAAVRVPRAKQVMDLLQVGARALLDAVERIAGVRRLVTRREVNLCVVPLRAILAVEEPAAVCTRV